MTSIPIIRARVVLLVCLALGCAAHAQPESWTVNGESMPLDEFIAKWPKSPARRSS